MNEPSDTNGPILPSTGRTLLLLRHAKSSWDDPSLSDKQRPLNARGRKAASAMAPRIAEWQPDHVLCSTAQRTRETLAPFMSATVGEAHIQLTDVLYEGGQAAYLDCARAVPDTAHCALLIGHNPTIEDLVHGLISEPNETLMQRIALKYPTGTLAVFHCPIARWQDLAFDSNQLIDLVRPADLATKL